MKTARPDKHGRVFLYLVKSDLSSVRYCKVYARVHWTMDIGQVYVLRVRLKILAFHKVPETHGHV